MPRSRPASRRSRSTRSSNAASTITRCVRSRRAVPRLPVIVRFIEFMDVGNRNDWRPEMVVPSRELAARIQARWPMHPISENYRGEVAERWRFDDGAGEIGFISSVSQPFCGSLQPRAALLGGKVLYLPVRNRGLGSARTAARGADDAELSNDARRLARSRRSLQRTARRAAPREHGARRSRCITSAVDAMTIFSFGFRAPPDDGRCQRQDRRAAHRGCRDARALSAASRRRLRESGLRSAKGPVFDTAIVAGVMGAKRTHELIPFCHPLGLESCKIVIELEGDAAVIRCTVTRAPQDRRRNGGAHGREHRRADDLRHVQGAVARHRDQRNALLSKEGGKSDFGLQTAT
jgi:hypothetical protein